MATQKIRKPYTVIRNGNVRVPVYRREQVVRGRTYSGYLVPDHSTGRRKLWFFSQPEGAKAKAKEIADAVATGRAEVLAWEDTLRTELRLALRAVEPTGINILPACQMFADAVKTLGGADQLLVACQHWKVNGPTKALTPKLVGEAVDDFLKRQKVRERRLRVLKTYLLRFVQKFKGQMIHEIEAAAITDFVDAQRWAPKTRNEALSTFGLLFKEGQLRNWVSKDFNPAKSVRREKVIAGAIEVFEPSEAKQMLSRVDKDLIPFLALWCFAGIRKQEISRMNWQQVNRGLETGWIVLEAKQTKTGQTRSIPIADNLKVWLGFHSKLSGDVLPKRWQSMTQLDDLTKYISRKTGIVWKDNAPRHSFGTYHFKLHKDAGATVAAMGNSLSKFQKHYWNRSNSITENVARDWFSIVPEQAGKIVPLAVAIDNSPDQVVI
jgi:hypothetical protein